MNEYTLTNANTMGTEEQLPNLYPGNTELLLTLFPSLIKWSNSKLADICYISAMFFNYLTEPRSGFIPINNTKLLSIKQQQKINAAKYKPNNSADKNISEDIIIASISDSISPVITAEMIEYVLGDIFPCSSMIKEQHFKISQISPKLCEHIRAIMTQYLNRSNTFINNKVCQVIWTYLSNGINALAYNSSSDNNVKNKITEAESIVLTRRNFSKNYGFNDDAENSSFQTILYIAVSLVDWLEFDYITETEVRTIYKIIVPLDLQEELTYTDNKLFTNIITTAFRSKNLIINEQAVNLISTMMTQVGYHMNHMYDNPKSIRIMSRYFGLAQSV